jgi:hypothetical protein
MVIFNSYVKLPEGIQVHGENWPNATPVLNNLSRFSYNNRPIVQIITPTLVKLGLRSSGFATCWIPVVTLPVSGNRPWSTHDISMDKSSIGLW